MSDPSRATSNSVRRFHDWLRPWVRTERLCPLPGDERPALFHAVLETTWPHGSRLTVESNECWLEKRRWRWAL